MSMEFRYGSSFGVEPPEAYERLLLDCLLGDGTLFTRARRGRGELGVGVAHPPPLGRGGRRRQDAPSPTYPAGSWGPEEADELLTADGRAWRLP